RYLPDYGYALILREGQKDLDSISQRTPYSITIEESMKVRFDDSTRFQITTTYAGGAADDMRSLTSSESLKDIEAEYRGRYAKAYEGIEASKPIEMSDDSLENRYSTTEHYSIPDVWRPGNDGRRSFDIYARPIHSVLPNPTGQTAGTPLALSYPRRLDYTLDLYMPREWSFTTPAWQTKTGSYEFSFRPEVHGNRVTLMYTFQTFRDHIPAGEMERYKSDYKQMVDLVEFTLSYGNSSPSSSYTHGGSSSSGLGDLVSGWTGIWILFGLGLTLTVVLKGLPAWTTRFRRRRDDYM
ncbi:MAG: hypothetical protein JST39_10435, partial [Bacteroidetes bacterium]|nr:hypothetical protein [Bacteroidota bacterium]